MITTLKPFAGWFFQNSFSFGFLIVFPLVSDEDRPEWLWHIGWALAGAAAGRGLSNVTFEIRKKILS